MCRMCRGKMCRTLAGENVSQRAPRVVFECVVECVVNHDTYDTFLFTVRVFNCIHSRYSVVVFSSIFGCTIRFISVSKTN